MTILSFIISCGTSRHDDRWTHGSFKDLGVKFIYSKFEHWCLDHEFCLREIHYFKFGFVSGYRRDRIHLTFLESSLTPLRHFVLSVPFSFFSSILSLCFFTCLFHSICKFVFKLFVKCCLNMLSLFSHYNRHSF